MAAKESTPLDGFTTLIVTGPVPGEPPLSDMNVSQLICETPVTSTPPLVGARATDPVE